MARRKTRKRASLVPQQRRWISRLLSVGAAAITVVAGAYALHRLERAVLRSSTQTAPAKITLVDVPADLEDAVSASLESFARVPWSSPALCADIARTLEGVAWVKQVVRVRRFSDRRIEVRCTYRRPLALVQMDGAFYLVDEDGVRLPGRYANDPSMTLVQGVVAAAPRPGEQWSAPDLHAGLELVKLFLTETFANQITAVLVRNYGGRVDARAAHIELATDRAGGRIIWGSAPGEEVEENTVMQKLELLRGNYRRFGRVDAGRGVIDVSIHPDRIITST